MNHIILSAIEEIPWFSLIGGVGAIVLVIFIFAGIWASRYMKVGPNQVLVISGRKRRMVDPDGTARDVGFRIVKGGGVFVYPVLERSTFSHSNCSPSMSRRPRSTQARESR